MIRPTGPTTLELLAHCISIVKSFLLRYVDKHLDKHTDKHLSFFLYLFDTKLKADEKHKICHKKEHKISQQ